MGHPIKAPILVELGGSDPLSAAEVAARTGMPVRSVRHQMSRLAVDGLIGMSASRERRGALEKLYELRVRTFLDTDDFEQMTPDASRRAVTEVFRRIVADVTRVLDAGSFDWNESCEVRIGAEVDEEGWIAITGIVRGAYEKVEEAGARAARRIARSEEDPKLGISVLLWFERPWAGDPAWVSAAAGYLPGRRFAALGIPPGEERRPATSGPIAALAAAMGHSVRAKILFALSDTHPLAVARIADRIGEAPRKIRYHLGRLLDDGLVERLEGRGPVRYSLLVIPLLEAEDLARLGSDDRRRVWTEAFRRIVIDAAGAISAGSFYRRPDFWQSRVPMTVDAEGWAEIEAISVRAFEAIEAAHVEAGTRLTASGTRPTAATAAILWVELPRG